MKSIKKKENTDNDADYENLEEDFLNAIGKDFLILLENDYEYLQSDDAIIETIQSNAYEFTKDGKLDNHE